MLPDDVKGLSVGGGMKRHRLIKERAVGTW